MTSLETFYLCPTCFAATQEQQHHEHGMIVVHGLDLDASQRQPIIDAGGRLLTQAPHWFVASTRPLAFGHRR